jgi:hypothetical protein
MTWGSSKESAGRNITMHCYAKNASKAILQYFSIQDAVLKEHDTKELPTCSQSLRSFFLSTNSGGEKVNPLDIRNVKDSRLRLQDLTGTSNLDISLLRIPSLSTKSLRHIFHSGCLRRTEQEILSSPNSHNDAHPIVSLLLVVLLESLIVFGLSFGGGDQLTVDFGYLPYLTCDVDSCPYQLFSSLDPLFPHRDVCST